MGLTPAAREELEATCKKVFNEFDADHGGTVDTDEMSTDEKHTTPGVSVNKDDSRVVEFGGVKGTDWACVVLDSDLRTGVGTER